MRFIWCSKEIFELSCMMKKTSGTGKIGEECFRAGVEGLDGSRTVVNSSFRFALRGRTVLLWNWNLK